MSTQSDYFIKNLSTLSDIYANNDPLPKWNFPKKWFCYVTWWKWSQWTSFNSPVSSAGMKERRGDDTVRMPQSLYACFPRGLWVIKCGWVCPWLPSLALEKGHQLELSQGSKRGGERSDGGENRESSPKDEMHGDTANARKPFSHYHRQWSHSGWSAPWLFYPEVSG